MAVTGLADALLTLLFAPRCAACDVPLARPSAGPVCAVCWQQVTPLAEPRCSRCGDALAPGSQSLPESHGCPRCHHRPRAITRAAAAAAYEPSLRQIIHALKYDGRRSLAAPLAELLVVRCRPVFEGADCLVPVPLHPLRRLTRGFNQAHDLARHLARLLSRQQPDLPTPRVLPALARRRRTRPQEGLTVDGRRANVSGAFRLSGRVTAHTRQASLEGRIVVLVDDVRTTGATLDQCAAVLLDAGAADVRAVTVALARRLSPQAPPQDVPPDDY